MLAFQEAMAVVGEPAVVNLEVIKPRSFRSRLAFDRDLELEQLVDSISRHGILQPLVVRHLQEDIEGYEYELVAGERRYLAARMAEFHEIPVTVCELDEREAFIVSLVENLQRKNLNPIEEAQVILQLLSLHLELDIEKVKSLLYQLYNFQGGKVSEAVINQEHLRVVEQVFEQIGSLTLSNFVKHRMSLLNLSSELQEAIADGLSYTKAKELNRISDRQRRQELLQQTIDEDLSVRALKEIVQSILNGVKNDGDRRSDDADISAVVRDQTGEQAGANLSDVQNSSAVLSLNGVKTDSDNGSPAADTINSAIVDGADRDETGENMGAVRGDRGNLCESAVDDLTDEDEIIDDDELEQSGETEQSGELEQSSESEHVQQPVSSVAPRELEQSSESEHVQQPVSSVAPVVSVVNQLESFAHQVIVPKLESDHRKKFLLLFEELKQLIEA